MTSPVVIEVEDTLTIKNKLEDKYWIWKGDGSKKFFNIEDTWIKYGHTVITEDSLTAIKYID